MKSAVVLGSERKTLRTDLRFPELVINIGSVADSNYGDDTNKVIYLVKKSVRTNSCTKEPNEFIA